MLAWSPPAIMSNENHRFLEATYEGYLVHEEVEGEEEYVLIELMSDCVVRLRIAPEQRAMATRFVRRRVQIRGIAQINRFGSTIEIHVEHISSW